MRFELQPPFVLVHDSKPGMHATLFGTHTLYGKGVVRYPFRGDASKFDDATSTYVWAFEANPADGELLVFATSDREVIGEAQPHVGAVSAYTTHPHGLQVYRFEGKPITLR